MDHYRVYFKETGKTMRYTNGEFPEGCHSTLRKSEERKGFKVKRVLGTPIHQQKSLQSLTQFNSTKIGYLTPIRMRKKSSQTSSSLGMPQKSLIFCLFQ